MGRGLFSYGVSALPRKRRSASRQLSWDSLRMRESGFLSCQLLSAALAMLALPNALFAAEPDAGLSLFREKVEPLLKERCFECHSHAADEVGGGLMLDSRSGWATGGDSGPAILP